MDSAASAVRAAPKSSRISFRPFAALRDCLSEGYSLSRLRQDILAGAIVGTIALPLSMALAIASGVKPEHGLFTAIVGGAVIALLGGSRVQVSGPTAAFVVILAPIAHHWGVSGLLLATFMAGVILTVMGLGGFGKLIEFIPHPVTLGFTAGIATVIATLQVKDFLGLTPAEAPSEFIARVGALIHALPTVRWPDATIGVFTLSLLIGLPRITRVVPAPIVALPLAALIGLALTSLGPEYQPDTIQTRFGGIPQRLPGLWLPWSGTAPDGSALQVRPLIGAAFAIAMLGAIESLLSAVIADGMTGRRHDPDAELFAQGVGNMLAPLVGGIAATGAIARTATSIRYGATSPIACITHAIFVLLAMLLLAPALGYLPMSAMAAQLLIVAWNMSEAKHLVRSVRVAPISDVLVLLTCLGLTIVFDMVISVSVGVVLAAVLFMRRMAELATVRLHSDYHAHANEFLPPGAMIYEVGGPMFFGAAQRAFSALRSVGPGVRIVLLDLRGAPMMDSTALVALESAIESLHQQKVFVVIAGVQEQPLRLMAKAGWKHRPWLVVWRSFEDGLALVRTLAPSDFDAMDKGDLSRIMHAAHA